MVLLAFTFGVTWPICKRRVINMFWGSVIHWLVVNMPELPLFNKEQAEHCKQKKLTIPLVGTAVFLNPQVVWAQCFGTNNLRLK
eukprot:521462-Amphidinium_carterae.2